MSRFVSMAGERVAELADRCAEAGRLSRGRALFRKGSVSDLSVLEGSVIASVRGSQGDGYETTISTALAPAGIVRQLTQAYDPANPQSLDDLIADGLDVCPREMDLAFTCDCADWEEPCKHVVAVFLAFADRVDLDEVELLRWRGIVLTGSDDEKPEDASRSRSSWRARSSAEPEAEPRPRAVVEPRSRKQSGAVVRTMDELDDRTARLSELEALLGDTAMRVPTTDDADPEPSATSLDPALAAFLGVEIVLDAIDVSSITAPDPLFAEVQLGPLADLGPVLAEAMATIIARLGDASTE